MLRMLIGNDSKTPCIMQTVDPYRCHRRSESSLHRCGKGTIRSGHDVHPPKSDLNSSHFFRDVFLEDKYGGEMKDISRREEKKKGSRSNVDSDEYSMNGRRLGMNGR